MAIIELFSRRELLRTGSDPDVYQYENIPKILRNQVVHVLVDLLGEGHIYEEKPYETIDKVVAREHGLLNLGRPAERSVHRVQNTILSGQPSLVLDIIECAFLLRNGSETWSRGATEINERFKRSGVGYRLENYRLIRVDSEFSHGNIIRPTIILLRQPEFSAAESEFLRAHEHYRHGRHEEALVDGAKAIESVIKVVASRRGWILAPTPTLSALVLKLFEEGLVPSYLQAEFTSLQALLSSGGTPRNRDAAHGAGVQARVVPEHLVELALNTAASIILFIVESDRVAP